jgi:hypothetical protein
LIHRLVNPLLIELSPLDFTGFCGRKLDARFKRVFRVRRQWASFCPMFHFPWIVGALLFRKKKFTFGHLQREEKPNLSFLNIQKGELSIHLGDLFR